MRWLACVVGMAVAWPALAAGPPLGRLDADGYLLPHGALARLGTRGLWQEGEVSAVAVSADRRRVASANRAAGDARRVCAWDAGTGKLTWSAPARVEVESLAFSPDGRWLAAGGRGEVTVWRAADGREVSQWDGPLKHISEVRFLPDARTLVVAWELGQVDFRDVTTGPRWSAVKTAPPWRVSEPRVSPDGRSIAWLARTPFTAPQLGDGVLVEEALTGRKRCWFACDPAVVYGPADELFRGVVGGVEVHDARTGKAKRSFPSLGGAGDVSPRAAAGGVLVTAEGDHLCVRLTGDGRLLRAIDAPPRAARRWGRRAPVALSDCGRTLAYAARGRVVIIDVATGAGPALLGATGPISSLRFSADSRRLASASDLTWCEWEVATTRLTRRAVMSTRHLREGERHVPGAATGSQYLTEGPYRSLKVRDFTTGRKLRDLTLLGPAWQTVASANGKVMVVIAGPEVNYRVHLISGDEPHQVTELPKRRYSGLVALSPDDRALLMATFRGELWELDAVTGGSETRFCPGPGKMEQWRGHVGAFSADAQTLAVVCHATQLGARRGSTWLVRVWHVQTRRQLARWEVVVTTGAQAGSPPVALSGDGRALALATPGESTVQLWEVASGRKWADLPLRGGAASLAFSPDGRLASGSEDGTVVVWDLGAFIPSSPPRFPRPSSGQAEALWEGLADYRYARAGSTLRALTVDPKQAVRLLRARLRPVRLVPEKKVVALVKDLASDDFATRKGATRELEQLGEGAGKQLRAAAREHPDFEVRARLGRLIEGLDGPTLSPHSLRLVRAVEVLERIGDEEAVSLLRQLGGGLPEARLTLEANMALARLERKKKD